MKNIAELSQFEPETVVRPGSPSPSRQLCSVGREIVIAGLLRAVQYGCR